MKDYLADSEAPPEILRSIGKDPEANRMYALWSLSRRLGSSNRNATNSRIDDFVRRQLPPRTPSLVEK